MQEQQPPPPVTEPISLPEVLSEELIVLLLSFLEPQHLCRAALACSEWARLVQSDSVWRDLYFRDAPSSVFGVNADALEAGRSLRELYRDEVWYRWCVCLSEVGPRYNIKLLLLGPGSVGKSTFLHRLCCGTLDTYPDISTIGVDCRITQVALGGTRAKVVIWDTAGTSRFRNMVSSYYPGTHGAFVMFDVMDRESYYEALRRFEEYSVGLPSRAVILLVGLNAGEAGNQDRARQVSAREAHARAATLQTAEGRPVRYFECDAISGRGVEHAAYALVQPVLTSLQQAGEEPVEPTAAARPAPTAAARPAQVWASALDVGSAACAWARISVLKPAAPALLQLARPVLKPAAPALLQLARAWDEYFEC